MKKIETFVGDCSKFIDGQGWTTKIPISQLNDKGYYKIDTVLRQFANRVKNEFYAQFDEIIPSIMSDKIDSILDEFIGDIK